MSHFELWDMESANKVGTAPTREAALNVVRDFLATGDPYYETNLSMTRVDDAGEPWPVANGAALIRLARAFSHGVRTNASATSAADPGLRDTVLQRLKRAMNELHETLRVRQLMWDDSLDRLSFEVVDPPAPMILALDAVQVPHYSGQTSGSVIVTIDHWSESSGRLPFLAEAWHQMLGSFAGRRSITIEPEQPSPLAPEVDRFIGELVGGGQRPRFRG